MTNHNPYNASRAALIYAEMFGLDPEGAEHDALAEKLDDLLEQLEDWYAEYLTYDDEDFAQLFPDYVEDVLINGDLELSAGEVDALLLSASVKAYRESWNRIYKPEAYL